MKAIALHTPLFLALLCLLSCEKDFVTDEDCRPSNRGNSVPSWSEDSDSTMTPRQDSEGAGFDISIDEWGDTISRDINF